MSLRRGGSAVASKPDRAGINRISLSSLRTRPGVHLLVVVLLISVPRVARYDRALERAHAQQKERTKTRENENICVQIFAHDPH